MDMVRGMPVPADVSFTCMLGCAWMALPKTRPDVATPRLNGGETRAARRGRVCTADEQAAVMRDGRGRPVCRLGTVNP